MLDSTTIHMLVEGTGATLYMTLLSTFFGYVLGLPIGIILTITDKEGIKPNAVVYKILDFIVNILRSIPFLILLILLIPVTRFIVGKSYGSNGCTACFCSSSFYRPYGGIFLKGSGQGRDRSRTEYGCRHYDDHLEGASGRGSYLPSRRSDDRDRNDPRLLRNGRCCRWRRTW